MSPIKAVQKHLDPWAGYPKQSAGFLCTGSWEHRCWHLTAEADRTQTQHAQRLSLLCWQGGFKLWQKALSLPTPKTTQQQDFSRKLTCPHKPQCSKTRQQCSRNKFIQSFQLLCQEICHPKRNVYWICSSNFMWHTKVIVLHFSLIV